MDPAVFGVTWQEEAAANQAACVESAATIFASVFSTDGAQLITGSSTGRIAVTDVSTMTRAKGHGTVRWFRAHGSRIYTLVLTPDGSTLVSGSATEIRLWRWADVMACLSSGTAPKHVAQLDPGCETNGLAYDPQTATLFAATGDGLCHGYDASSGKQTVACSGHTNYLHTVVVLPKSRQLATGSEDGTVKLWDLRCGTGASCTGTLEPFSDSDGKPRTTTARSISTSWVSCLACDPNDNWLVCGGSGHYLNTYHIGSRKSMNTMPTGSATQAVLFVESELVSVGAEPNVYHHSIGGTLVARVPTTCPSNFGIAYAARPHGRLLVVCGAGTEADVFTDFHSPPAYSTSLLFGGQVAAAESQVKTGEPAAKKIKTDDHE